MNLIHFHPLKFHIFPFQPCFGASKHPLFHNIRGVRGVRGGAVPSHDGHPETWHALLSGIKAWWLQRPPGSGAAFQGGLVKWRRGSPGVSASKYDDVRTVIDHMMIWMMIVWWLWWWYDDYDDDMMIIWWWYDLYDDINDDIHDDYDDDINDDLIWICEWGYNGLEPTSTSQLFIPFA